MSDTRQQFISRMMEDKGMKDEFPDEEIRMIVAAAKWDNKAKLQLNGFEIKSINTGFELKDFDRNKRTAVIAHSVYDVIDRSDDISRKGMFNRTWDHSKKAGIEKSIGFFVNHDSERQPGLVKDTWETENKAYTQVWFGNHTLGNDVMTMMDDGIIRDASFSFKAIQKNIKEIKGKKIRELKEVLQGETSVVYGLDPVNPLAGVVSVSKAETPIQQFKAHLERLELFCRNTSASDGIIQSIEAEIKSAKEIFGFSDTVDTHLINDPSASVNKRFSDALHLLTLKI